MKRFAILFLMLFSVSSLSGQNRVKTWTNEVLTPGDLNAEFDNVYEGNISRTAGYWGTEDDIALFFGSSQDVQFEWDTGQTNDLLSIGLGTTNLWLVGEKADMGTNYGIASQSNPTFVVHSADSATAKDYIWISHNQTDAVINSGAGGYSIQADGTEITDITSGGDWVFKGTTPRLTVGDAGAEDTAVVFDGNAQDFYVALDDSADDLILGLGSIVGTTGIIFLDENQDVGIGTASAGAKLGVTGNVLIDGGADEIQLTVQGNATQTTEAFVVEQSDGTDTVTIDDSGNVYLVSGSLGIGVDPATTALHVKGGASGATGSSTYQAILEKDGAGGLQILTPNTATGRIVFGDPEDDDRGRIYYDHATDYMSFWTLATERVTIDNAGQVGIRDTSPDAQLDIVSRSSATVGLIVDTAASATADAQQWGFNGTESADFLISSSNTRLRFLARDLGNDVAGTRLEIQRNTNAGTEGPSAGYLMLERASGTDGNLWVDASGDLRIHTVPPTGSSGSPTVSDTAGTVVGTQTSVRSEKNIYGPGITPEAALEALLGTDVYRFNYKSGRFGGEQFDGVVIDTGKEWYAADRGRVLNPISTVGYTIQSIKALEAKIAAAEAKIARLESGH